MSFLVLPLLGVGCAPNLPPGALWDAPAFVVPTELATSTGRISPTIIIEQRYIAPETLEELIARIRLVSWPDRAPVPTRADFSPADTVEHPNTSELTLVPTEELGDGWYAVLFDARNLDGYRGTGAELEPGFWASRFRTDSQPIVRSVGIANSSEGRAHVRLEITEPVDEAREAAAVVTVSTGEELLPCEPAEDGIVVIQGWDVCRPLLPHGGPRRAGHGGAGARFRWRKSGTVRVRRGRSVRDLHAVRWGP